MPIYSHPQTTPKAVVVEGVIFHKSEWLESGADPDFSPTVFLVEQPPEASLRTHFHKQNQFQVFVRGSGSIGPHRLEALTVHYAGAYTGYGPIVSGSEGIAYFTLRTVNEIGSRTMKEHAGEMKRGPKRQLHSQPAAVATQAWLHALQAPLVSDLIEPQPDLIFAQLISLAPGLSFEGRDPHGSAGQFYLVLAGSARVGERSLEHWDSVFVDAGDGSLELAAGANGAQLVCVQIPHKAAEYR